ncbi:hypothetical protein H8S37_12940, partial [Mediterraneibacter sp. NSJ-55]|nr:hypothetical protein [Mediterraneibacter hominis]
MGKRQRNKRPLYKLIGYSFIALYALCAIAFLTFCADLHMLPTTYMLIGGTVFSIFGVIFTIMQEKPALSVVADILCVLLAAGCIFGCYYIHKTNTTIQEVATADKQTDIVSVYVMEDDPAQSIEDAADYSFGISTAIDRENTDKTVKELEESLGNTLDTQEYDNVFDMADDLKEGKTGAIILNSAYLGIIADVEGYEWAGTGLREITNVAHEVEKEETAAVPDNVPDTFIMYLSGIDTYGGVSARSRSDVNILAVVNTETKNVLLLSTPRDYYVEYSVTGGA